jgi:hypothetical protein
MKHKNIVLPHISLIFSILATTLIACAAEKEPVTQYGGEAVLETIPRSARFDLKDIKGDRYDLVGRLSLRRQFMGTIATPQYHDVVQFHCFNGDELKFPSFTDPESESRLVKTLANGRSLPAIVTVRFERIRVGHDGINMSERLVAHIDAFKPTTVESIRAAAEAAGFDAADYSQYKAALDPDVVKGGIAVSLGEVSVRSEVTPGAAALAIHGIRVFNSTSEVVSVEIIGLVIEQEGVSQRCVMNKRSSGPHSWQVEAASWSDGAYEQGEMPRILWMFDPPEPIEPKKKVAVELELKVNGKEPLTLTRNVDPL